MNVKNALAISVLAAATALSAKEYRGVVIIRPENPTLSEEFAVKELQYHLEKDLNINYSYHLLSKIQPKKYLEYYHRLI